MTITARLSGTCKRCGGRIAKGDRIEWVKGQGAEHVECPEGQVRTPVTQAPTVRTIDPNLTPGVYEVEGTVYVVRPNKDKTRLYAKVLVETGGTRITEAGVEVREIDFEYKPGAIFGIKAEHRMDVERAKALTALYGRCIVCGRHLKAAESVERGIGPVCIKSFKQPVADPTVETADGREGRLSDLTAVEVDGTVVAVTQRVNLTEPDEANLDTIKASEVGWMITTVDRALSCAGGQYDLPTDDIERVKAMLGRLIADGIEHGRVIA